MARNKFGVICDMCGEYTTMRSMYYRLALPTYQSSINNSIQYLDFCPDCYKDLKITLAKHYNIEWKD